MRLWKVKDLEEARMVLEHHTREQHYEGLKRPSVWVIENGHPPCLVMVVSATKKTAGCVQRLYEYLIEKDVEPIKDLVVSRCGLLNINPRTERKRWKDEEEREREMQRSWRREALPTKPLISEDGRQWQQAVLSELKTMIQDI